MTVTGTQQRVYGNVISYFRILQIEYDIYIEPSPSNIQIRIRTPGIRFVSSGIARYADCGFFSPDDDRNTVYLFFCHSGGGVGLCFKRDWAVTRQTWHHVKEKYDGIEHKYTITVNDIHSHTMDMDIDVKYLTMGYFSNGDIGTNMRSYNWRVKNVVIKDLETDRTILTHNFPGSSLDMDVWRVGNYQSPLVLPQVSSNQCIFTTSTFTEIIMKEQFILVSK